MLYVPIHSANATAANLEIEIIHRDNFLLYDIYERDVQADRIIKNMFITMHGQHFRA